MEDMESEGLQGEKRQLPGDSSGENGIRKSNDREDASECKAGGDPAGNGKGNEINVLAGYHG